MGTKLIIKTHLGLWQCLDQEEHLHHLKLHSFLIQLNNLIITFLAFVNLGLFFFVLIVKFVSVRNQKRINIEVT